MGAVHPPVGVVVGADPPVRILSGCVALRYGGAELHFLLVALLEIVPAVAFVVKFGFVTEA